METVIVNLFGGPGIGKSTCAAHLFYLLKTANQEAELVTEYAKDLTWSDRYKCLTCQPYVFGKQLYRLERLIGKVKYIVNDSPILLSIIYNQRYPGAFDLAVQTIFSLMNNRNFLLVRGDRRYSIKGRNQTKQEAVEIDKRIRKLLLDCKVSFTTINSDVNAAEKIFEAVVDKN